jgi:hypothetical protein
MSEAVSIRGLIERVTQGTIRIPKFQRPFVWDTENVAFLMDSIYRGYPIGNVLLWRTEDQLSAERDLGPFSLPAPAKKWPVDYVLDGQQRITSLFGVFQYNLEPKTPEERFDIYFDLDAPEGALEDQFVTYEGEGEAPKNYFPLRLLLNAAPFAKATHSLEESRLLRVIELQRRFQEASIKTEVVDLTDREQIAIIFERVNRAGVRLDTFQLLTAWTWSNEFDLTDRLDALGSEVEPYGYAEISNQRDLLMRCCSAVITGDATIKKVIDLHGPTVRDRFDDIRRGILGAIEFLRSSLQVHALEVMPYPAMIVPLSRFFATDKVSGFHPSAAQKKQLVRWYWRSCFSRRYSSGVNRAYAYDIASMDGLKADEHLDIAKFPILINADDFVNSRFNIQAVMTKIFISILSNQNPHSLISDHPIDLEQVLLRCNRNEFHHIFPKQHLVEDPSSTLTNSLANLCFLTAADNQKIKDKPPAVYQELIPETIRARVLSSAVIPEGWSDMQFSDFLKARANELVARAYELAA